MEMSPRGSARHKGTRWGGPRPSQPLSTMFANTGGHFLRGRRRGEDEGGSHTPRRWGWGPGGGSRFTPKPPLQSPPWHPAWAGVAQGLLLAARGGGAGAAGRNVPRSMPTRPGLTALKSGCHFPSGQPFTSIRRALLGARRLQPRQTQHLTLRGPTAPPGSTGARGHFQDGMPQGARTLPRGVLGSPAPQDPPNFSPQPPMATPNLPTRGKARSPSPQDGGLAAILQTPRPPRDPFPPPRTPRGTPTLRPWPPMKARSLFLGHN